MSASSKILNKTLNKDKINVKFGTCSFGCKLSTIMYGGTHAKNFFKYNYYLTQKNIINCSIIKVMPILLYKINHVESSILTLI
jgi:hypothetical protein